MSYIEVNTTWTSQGNGGGGNTATGTGTAFNTDTKQIEPWGDSRNLATLDPRPPNVHLAVGTLIYFECDVDLTATKWFYEGGTATRIETELQSASYCGYSPPLSCDLGTASVQQLAGPTSAQLTFLFSGTANGQAWYCLDGGSEQSSPTFPNVSAGPHTLVVRDDGLAGCTRSLDVLVVLATVPVVLPPTAPTGAAQGVDFVGQPLWFAPAAVPAGTRVQLELYAETSHGAEDFALVLSLRKVADAAGHVSFRLDTLLWPLLSAGVPTLGGTRRSTRNLVNYFVRTASTAPGQATTYATGPLRTALRGALPAEWPLRTEFFAQRSSAAFLSWQPLGPGAYAAGQAKPVTFAQPEWLGWLCPVAAPGLRIARAYDMGPGTQPVVDYETLPDPPARGWQNQLLAIPLGATRPGFARLSVQVQLPDGQPLSVPAWYSFVEETPRTRYLLFTNSLGTVDTLRCTGRLEATLEASASTAERPARKGDAAATADQQLSELVASRKLKLATGWLSPEELRWAQELVLSRELWLAVGAQLRPLDWGKRSLAAYADEPGLRGLLLEFDYAYSPTAYAPGTY